LRVANLSDLDDESRIGPLREFHDHDAAGNLIRLFVLGHTVPSEDLTDAVRATLDPLHRTGLVAFDGQGRLYSPVRLVPLDTDLGRTLYIASDRSDNPDGSPFQPFADIVFSGHNPLTREFLRLLPKTRVERVLDLCSGTGVGAIVMERFASAVVAVDVTERCTVFAEFNKWLNTSTRVEIRRGDLYEPVSEERFDRIIAHPPYVPASAQSLIYRDGGETGDVLLQRIVAGLPQRLSPAGTFHALSIGMDAAGASFESRVRGWLGDASAEFDVVFALGSRMSPEEFARSLAMRRQGSPEEFTQRMDLFTKLAVTDVVYGALVVRRFDRSTGSAQTRRVFASGNTTADSFLWLLDWFDRMRRPDFAETLLGSRPLLSSGSQLHVDYRVRDGRFNPETFRLLDESASFRVQLETEGWVVALLNAFNGERTVMDIYRQAEGGKALPDGFGERDVVGMISLMLERGFLRLSA
jgi:methylase of polypeptide subunit release factors